MRVALYLRCSTEEQNIEYQRDFLIDWCKKKGHLIITEYGDEGVSGSTLSRPALKNMLNGTKYQGFDGIVVYKIDRISRKYEDFFQVLQRLKKENIQLISATDGIEMMKELNAMDTAMLQVRMVFAQLERGLALERSKEMRAKAIEKGYYVCRPPFGYRVVGKKLIVDESKAFLVRELYRDKKRLTLYALGKKYNIPISSLRHILRNPIYRTGEIRINDRIVGHCERILRGD